MNRTAIHSLWLFGLLAACSAELPLQASAALPVDGQEAAAPSQASSEKPEQEHEEAQGAMNEAPAMNEFKPFVGADQKILASQIGDLNSDGLQDAILVLDSTKTDQQMLGKGDPRAMLLLMRDQGGLLVEAGRNTRLVPCANCGGSIGDPFGYARADKGEFAVLLEGGSREHWSKEYVFRFNADKKQWLLETVTHRVTDTLTGQDKRQELTRADFGAIPFDTFDPSTLSFPDSH